MTELATVSILRAELAKAEDIETVRRIEDVARRRRDAELLESGNVALANQYAEIAVEAAVVVGESLGDASEHQGGRGKTLPGGEGFPHSSRNRYRKLYAIDESQRLEYYAQCRDQGEIISKAGVLRYQQGGSGSKLSPLMSSNSDEWYTPEHVWRTALAAHRIEAFDLDPCAEPERGVLARRHYTKDDDGFAWAWDGIVWMNPPYSAIDKWVTYLNNQCEVGNCKDFTALVPARVDTEWWRKLTAGCAGSVVFINGRLKFGGAKDSAPFPSALVFGCTDPDDVSSACASLGRTWRAM